MFICSRPQPPCLSDASKQVFDSGHDAVLLVEDRQGDLDIL
jgi:hypothetical protein